MVSLALIDAVRFAMAGKLRILALRVRQSSSSIAFIRSACACLSCSSQVVAGASPDPARTFDHAQPPSEHLAEFTRNDLVATNATARFARFPQDAGGRMDEATRAWALAAADKGKGAEIEKKPDRGRRLPGFMHAIVLEVLPPANSLSWNWLANPYGQPQPQPMEPSRRSKADPVAGSRPSLHCRI